MHNEGSIHDMVNPPHQKVKKITLEPVNGQKIDREKDRNRPSHEVRTGLG
jgi:hypothetical protein